MAAVILDGKSIAAEIRAELTERVQALSTEGEPPGLAVVLVGENPASVSYVRAKERDCENVGIRSFDHRLPESTSQQELLNLIERLNGDTRVDGILVQLPLPTQVEESVVLEAIDPSKDVDGFHPLSLGRLLLGLPSLLPCTPHGILQILQRSDIDPAGKHVVVIGRSNIVGKPVSLLLARKAAGGNATVTMCHSRTANLAEVTRRADILIAAIGSPEFVRADMVSPGTVVIDVGVNRVDADNERGFRLVGDVAFDEVREIAGAITPVPGGVGPLTRAMLLYNTVEAAQARRSTTKRA